MSAKLNIAAQCFASIPVFIGLVVMFGWLFHYPVLVQILPDLVPMQFNTALAACLAGISILALTRRFPPLSMGAAGLGFLLCFITFLQYPFSFNFGLDELIVEPYIAVNSPDPGRMALNTSLGFILLFSSLGFVQQRYFARQSLFLPTLLASVALALAVLSLFGYAIKLSSALGWSGFSQMAPHTALAIASAACGIVLNLRSSLSIPTKILKWKLAVTAGFIFTLSTGVFFAISQERRDIARALQQLDTADANAALQLLPSLETASTAMFVTLLIFVLLFIAQLLRHNQQRQTISDMEQLKLGTFNAMLDGLVVMDRQGIILEINESGARLFGYTAEELLGTKVNGLMPEPHQRNHDQYLADYQRTGQRKVIGRQRLLEGKKKTGETFPLLLQVNEREQQGSPVYVGVVHDMTDFYRLETEALKRTALLDAAMNVSSSGFIICDESGVVAELNSTAAAMIGADNEKIIGSKLVEYFQATAQKHLEEFFSGMLNGALDDSFELQLSANESEPLWVILNLVCIAELKLCIVHLVDVSELKQLNANLATRNAKLKTVNADLEKFAYVASHDLKAPLRGIRQTAEWIVEDLGSVPAEVQENIDLMNNRIRRMETLLSDLLNYYRVGSEKATPERVNAQELVEDIFALYEACENNNCQLVNKVEVLFVDKTALQQVLRNLIDNAIKHNDKHDGMVRVLASQVGEFYQFIVEDNGPGISRRYAEQVFDLFRTLRSRDEVEGSGMGLAVVKKMVEKSGGTINLLAREDLEDAGEETVHCRFILRWPRARAALERVTSDSD